MTNYLSVTEAAAETGYSVSLLRLRCTEGRVKGAIRIGERWAIPKPVTILPAERPRGRPTKQPR